MFGCFEFSSSSSPEVFFLVDDTVESDFFFIEDANESSLLGIKNAKLAQSFAFFLFSI